MIHEIPSEILLAEFGRATLMGSDAGAVVLECFGELSEEGPGTLAEVAGEFCVCLPEEACPPPHRRSRPIRLRLRLRLRLPLPLPRHSWPQVLFPRHRPASFSFGRLRLSLSRDLDQQVGWIGGFGSGQSQSQCQSQSQPHAQPHPNPWQCPVAYWQSTGQSDSRTGPWGSSESSESTRLLYFFAFLGLVEFFLVWPLVRVALACPAVHRV